MNKQKIEISNFSPHLFWDINSSEVNVNNHARFIIKKVLLYGFYNDWKIIFNLYGKQIVCDYAKNIRELDLKTASLISIISNIPLTDFECYTITQSNPKHWNF